jgi:hypothetical protein
LESDTYLMLGMDVGDLFSKENGMNQKATQFSAVR